ncbi:hypothetical protein KI387_042092, partial [Taxus chinensis]
EYGQLHAHPTYDRRVGEVISYGPPHCRTNLTYGGVDASSITPEPPLGVVPFQSDFQYLTNRRFALTFLTRCAWKGFGFGLYEQGRHTLIPVTTRKHNDRSGLGFPETPTQETPRVSPLTYQRDNEDPSSLPLLYPDMIEEDSPSINVVECQDDDSILTYLGADDSYIQRALPSETQTMLNESTIEINIHTEEDPHIVKIGQSLNTSEQAAFTTFLRTRNQAFAWSYADMPGIDPTIAVHNITLNPDSKPVKQKLRKMHPRIALLVKEELQRLLSVSFILPIDYPQWISNI